MDNSAETAQREGVVIIPPVFIHPTAQVNGSIIGPNVSLGAGCRVEHSIIRDSILEDEAAGDRRHPGKLAGRAAGASCSRRAGVINAGDNTEVTL